MSTSAVDEQFRSGAILRPYPHPFPNLWQTLIHRRLTNVYQTAPYIPFDNNSRFIFFSDCHRGDSSRIDAFAPNGTIFTHALEQYYQEGFTYVEVGDGDELWQHADFSAIRHAHGPVFDLLHRFDDEQRLHILMGNHDLQDGRGNPRQKDGIPTLDGLVLWHSHTGEQVFVVHGHQADFVSEKHYFMARFTVRHIWKRVLLMGWSEPPNQVNQEDAGGLIQRRSVEWVLSQQKRVAHRITQWVKKHRKIVICGHTHLPAIPAPGHPPYFNTGCCVNPGYITGLELVNGALTLVKWTAVSPNTFCRQPLSPSRPLSLFRF